MRISLRKMKFHAFHGVLPEERTLGNQYEVNLIVEVTETEAMADDKLEGTISYADLYEIVKQEMGTPSNLLEKVCIRIGDRISAEYSDLLKWGEIEITKIAPPIAGMIGEASISYEFPELPF